MKKQIILALLTTTLVGAATILISDGLIYLTTSLMALTIMCLFSYKRSTLTKVTRWAKANPKNAQVLITGLQLALITIGLFVGYNLKKLGFGLSDTTAYIFSAIMVLGFLSVPFLPKRSTIAIPKVVNRQRFSFVCISISIGVMMTFTGNRVGEVFPNSLVTNMLETIDQSIFPDDIKGGIELNNESISAIYSESNNVTLNEGASAFFVVNPVHDVNPKDKSILPNEVVPPTNLNKAPTSKKELRKARKELRKTKRKLRKQQRRAVVNTGLCALGILLIILLCGTLCAGICLMIGAFGSTTAVGIVAGLVLTVGSVFGMVEAAKWCRSE